MADTEVKIPGQSLSITTHPLTIQLTEHLPEDAPIYAIIGRITSEWSHFEHILDLIIWDLCDADKAALACVTGQLMGHFGRFRVIQTLMELRNTGNKKEVSDLINEIGAFSHKASNIAEKRNRAIHDPWYLSVGTGSPAQFKSMPFKDPMFGVVDIDQTKQKALIDEIIKLRVKAAFLRGEVRDAFAHKPTPAQPSNLVHKST